MRESIRVVDIRRLNMEIHDLQIRRISPPILFISFDCETDQNRRQASVTQGVTDGTLD